MTLSNIRWLEVGTEEFKPQDSFGRKFLNGTVREKLFPNHDEPLRSQRARILIFTSCPQWFSEQSLPTK